MENLIYFALIYAGLDILVSLVIFTYLLKNRDLLLRLRQAFNKPAPQPEYYCEEEDEEYDDEELKPRMKQSIDEVFGLKDS